MADNKLIDLIYSDDVKKVREYLDSIKNSYLTMFQSFLGYSDNNINKLTLDKNSPLSIAIKQNNPEIVKLLIEYGADANIRIYNKNLFEIALEKKTDIEIVKIIKDNSDYNGDHLIKKFIKDNYYNSYHRHDLTYEEMFEWLKLMQTPNFNIGEQTIFEVFYFNKRELIDELMKLPNFHLLDVDKNLLGREISYVIDYEDDIQSKIEKLLDLGANLDARGEIHGDLPLSAAIRKNNKDLVEFLINKGAKINHGNDYKHSPLTTALNEKKYDMVLFLIEKGADVNERCEGTLFERMLRIKLFEEYAIKNILKRSDFKMTENDKLALCHHYIKNDLNDELKQFLSENTLVDINALYDGKTLFGYAVEKNNVKIATIISDSEGFILEDKDAGEVAFKAYSFLKQNDYDQAQNFLGYLPNKNINLNNKHSKGIIIFLTIYANLINDGNYKQAEYIKNQTGFVLPEEVKDILASKIYDSLTVGDYEQVSTFLALGGDINSKIKNGRESTTIFSACIKENRYTQVKFIKEQSNFILQEEDKITLATKLLKLNDYSNLSEVTDLIELGADPNTKIEGVSVFNKLIQKGELILVLKLTDKFNFKISPEDTLELVPQLIKALKNGRYLDYSNMIEKWKIDPLLKVNESDIFSEILKTKSVGSLKRANKIKKQLQFDLRRSDLKIIKARFDSNPSDLEYLSELLDMDPKISDEIDINQTVIRFLTKKYSGRGSEYQQILDIRSLANLLKQFKFVGKLSEESIKHLNFNSAEQISRVSKDINYELLRLFIEIGADINIQNSYGVTALGSLIQNSSSYYHNKEFVSFLLKNGANIHELDSKGESIFINLLKNKKFNWIIDFADILGETADKKNDIYIENALNRFPELYKKIVDKPEFLQVLDKLNIKFDLNQKQDGETLLTKAIKDGNIGLVKRLINRDVHINEPNHESLLPLDLATKSGNIQAIRSLLALPDIAGDIEKAKEMIILKNILINQARNFPGKPYINFAHSVLSINDLANEDMLKQYKAMKLESIYFQTDQLKLDHEFASFVEKATRAGIKEILVFCDQGKSQLSNEEFLGFIAKNKIRINLNIAPVTNDDLSAVEKDKLANGNLLGCENVKLEENDYSLRYNNDHKIKLLNNKQCDEIILENYLDHRKKLIDPDSNDLYQANYIARDDSPQAERIQKNTNKNKINLEYSVSVSNQVSNTLETTLDKEISVDIDPEQESKKFRRNEACNLVEKLFSYSFSEDDLVTDRFSDKTSKIRSIIYDVFHSSKKIQYITEQALLILIKEHELIGELEIRGIDLDNLPEGLAFKSDTIFASDIRPSNMPINGFTIKKDYIDYSRMEGPFRSWLQYASKNGLTPLKYYQNRFPEINEFGRHDLGESFLNSNLGFPQNLKRLHVYFIYGDVIISYKSMVKEHIFPSRSTTDENYRGLDFIKLTKVEKQKIDQIYQEFSKRGIEQAFDNIIKSRHYSASDVVINRGDFLLKEETLTFFDKLFTEILPLNEPKKIDFFQKILSSTDGKKLYLEDIFLSIDFIYNKTQEFIVKQEIAKEHHDFINNAIISILQNLRKETFAAQLNKIYNSIEATAANGGNLYELLYYYNTTKRLSWMTQSDFKEELQEQKLNTINGRIILSKKEDLLTPFISSAKYYSIEFGFLGMMDVFKTLAEGTSQVERDDFRFKIYTYLSIIPPHQRTPVDNCLKFITKRNSMDFKTGKRNSGLEVDKIIENNFPMLPKWSDLNIDERIKFLDKQNHEVIRLLDSEIKQYYNLHREDITFLMSTGLISEDQKCNLIENFSSEQAHNSVKLLSLNAITSPGNYYDSIYPDQEFSSYLSVFSTLFEKVKIDRSFQMGKVVEKAHAEISYEHRYPTVHITYDNYEAIDLSSEVTEKIKLHKKMIDEFIQIHMQNQEFNFAQLTALGLVANLIPEAKEQTIEAAKDLSQYGQQFSQLLRISLATSITTAQDLSELTERANVINRNINFLNQDHNGVKIHQLLSENGNHPENLAFFALCFSKEQNLHFENLVSLITYINALDKNLKLQFLEKIAHTQMPFEGGKIIDNNFPSISLEDLRHPERLQNIIKNNDIPKIDYELKKRFNDISLDSRQNAPINLEKLAKLYLGQVDLDSLKDLNYKRLKQQLTSDPNFVLKLIKAPNDSNKEFVSAFSKDLLQGILENIAQRTNLFEVEVKKTIDLLFDSKRTLNEQFYDFETSYLILEKIAKKLPNSSDKLLLVEQFIKDPRIPQEKIYEILQYFNTIDNEKLANKNYSILELVQDVGNQILSKHFNSFKLSVDLFLNSEKQLDFKQLSSSLIALAKKNYSEEQTVKILTYCIENQDFTLAKLFSDIDGKTKNIEKSVELLTSITTKDIEKIDSHISLKKLINLKPLEKFNLIAKVIQKYDTDLSPQQYQLLYHSLVAKKEYERDHYQKIFSYLLNPGANLSKEETIKIVFSNFSQIDAIKDIFKKINDEQTNFNPERFRNKIRQITNLNADNYGSLQKKKAEQLFKNGENIYNLAKEYSSLSLAEISLKSQELQHKRRLLKENTSKEKLQVDLQFLALSCQAMHLTTGKFPRDTQILSMLTSIENEGNVAQQISTGQGKSLIVALHAAYLSYLGQITIVTTSSQELASRDLKESESFYRGMNLKLGSKTILANSEGQSIEDGGIYYSTPPDIALYLGQMKFNQHPNYEKLLADLSIISDEVDGKLTSEINYILGVTLINAEQAEAHSLFKHILEFSKSDVFLKSEVSRSNDVHNLIESIKIRFSQFDRSLQYPMSKLQLKKLEQNNNPEAKEIININNMLVKLEEQGVIFVLANLLEGAIQAKILKEGVDYVISESLNKLGEKLLNAIPINNAGTLAKGTRFGNTQPFVNLKIKEEHPESKLEPDCTFPSSIIYDLTAKNLLDYVRLAKGRIIGFTGTLGDPGQLEEFKEILAINSVAIPDYEDLRRVTTTYEVENKQEQYLALKNALDEDKSNRPILIFCETNEEAGKVLAILKNESKQNLQLGDISLSEEEMNEVIKSAGNNNYITVLTKGSGRGVDFKTEHRQGFVGYNLCTEVTLNDLFQISGRVGRQGTEGSMTSFFNKDQYKSFTNHDEFMKYLSKKQTLEREKKRFIADVNQYFNQVNVGNREQAIRSHDFIERTWKYILTNNDALPSEERKTLRQLHKQLLKAVNEEYPGDSKDLHKYLMKLKECLPGENPVCHLEAKFTLDPAIQEKKSVAYIITPQSFPEFLRLKEFENLARSIHMDKIQLATEKDSPEYQVFYGVFEDMQKAIVNTHTLAIGPVEREFNVTYNYHDVLPQNFTMYHMITGEGSSGSLMLDELVKSVNAYRSFTNNSYEIDKIAEIIANTRNAQEINFDQLDTSKTQAVAIYVKSSISAEGNEGHAESILIDNNLLYLVNRGGGSQDKPGVKIYELIDNQEEVEKNLSKLKNGVALGNLESDIINPIVKKDSKNNQPIYHYIPMPEQTIGNCGWTQLESQIKTITIAGRLHEAKGRVDFEKFPETAEYQSALKNSEQIYKDFLLYDQIRRIETELYIRDASFNPQYMGKLSMNQIDKRRSIWRAPISDEVFSATIKTFDENLSIFKHTIYEDYAEEMSQKAHVELLSSSGIGEALARNIGKNGKNLLVNLDLENLKSLEQIYNDIITIHLKDQLKQDQVLIKILTYINDNPENESIFLNQLQEIFDETKLKLEGKTYVIENSMREAANNQDHMLFSVLEDFTKKKRMSIKQPEFIQETSNFVKPYDPHNFDFYSNNLITQESSASKGNTRDEIRIKTPEISVDGIIHQIQFLQSVCTITKNAAYSLYCNFYVPIFAQNATKEELSQAKEIIKDSSTVLKEYSKTYDTLNVLYQLKVKQHNEKSDDNLRDEISKIEKIKNSFYEDIQTFKNLCRDFVILKKANIVIKNTHVEILEGQYKKLDKINQEIQETYVTSRINPKQMKLSSFKSLKSEAQRQDNNLGSNLPSNSPGRLLGKGFKGYITSKNPPAKSSEISYLRK